MNQISVVVLQPVPAALIGLTVPVTLLSIPASPATWLLCFVLDDLVGYWVHRMAHRTGWGWVDHLAHHSAPEFNFATAVRLGALGPLTPAVLAPIPLVLLGFPASMVISAHLANAVFQFFVHTERVGTLPRPLEFLFNTPAHHRLHHACNPCYLDCNYGGVFIVWDRMFGTFRASSEPVVYGTADGLYTQSAIRIALEPAVKLAGALAGAYRSPRTMFRLLFGPPCDWWAAPATQRDSTAAMSQGGSAEPGGGPAG